MSDNAPWERYKESNIEPVVQSQSTGSSPWEKYKESNIKPAKTEKTLNPIEKPKGTILGGLGEGLAATATGMAAKPVAEIAGLGALTKELISPSGGDPQAFKEHVQESLTYKPRTKFGENVAEYNPLALAGKAVGAIAAPVGRGAERGAAAIGVPQEWAKGIGRGTEEVINQAPGILGTKYSAAQSAKLPKRQAALNIEKSKNAPTDVIRDASQKAGLITPMEGESWISGITGTKKLDRFISHKNEPKFIELLGKDIGLGSGTPLTDSELSMARSRAAAPYREVEQAGNKLHHIVPVPGTGIPGLSSPKMIEKTGFNMTNEFSSSIRNQLEEIINLQEELPNTFKGYDESIKILSDYSKMDVLTPKAAMKSIRQLRKDATLELRSDDPIRIATGLTKKSISNGLEDLIEENLTHTGQHELVSKFKAARQLMAKTYDIQAAVDNTGRLDARKLVAMSKKKPLSGNLKLIADFAERFPEGAKKSVNSLDAISPWDSMMSLGAAMGGHGALALAKAAGSVAAPFVSKKGGFQKKTPSYKATNKRGKIAAPLGSATSLSTDKQ
jgi:hypothetical protein